MFAASEFRAGREGGASLRVSLPMCVSFEALHAHSLDSFPPYPASHTPATLMTSRGVQGLGALVESKLGSDSCVTLESTAVALGHC